jgi:hypothetical protein
VSEPWIWETSWRRVVVALGLGALTGGLLAPPSVLAGDLLRGAISPADLSFSDLVEAWPVLLAITLFAIAPYGIGLLAIGAPAWVIAHRIGLRHWSVAAALGAILNVSVLALLAHEGIWAFAMFRKGGALAFAPAGAIVGLVVWRVAYRKVSGFLPLETGRRW